MADIIQTDDEENKEYIGGCHPTRGGDLEFSLVRDRKKAQRFRKSDLDSLDFASIGCLVAYVKCYYGNEKKFISIDA